MPKITPREVLDGLNVLRLRLSAGRGWKEHTIWVTRARKLIGDQAAEIEDLKGKLAQHDEALLSTDAATETQQEGAQAAPYSTFDPNDPDAP